MKIGMILDKAFPVDDRVEKEALSLIEAGFEVHLLCFTFGDLPKRETYKGIQVQRVFMPRAVYKKLSALILRVPFYNWFWKKQIRRFVRERQINVLHVHDLPLCGVALEIKREWNGTLVADMHENYPSFIEEVAFANTIQGRLLISKQKWWQKEREWLNRVDRIVVVAEGMQQRLEKQLETGRKYTVTPNSPDVSRLLNEQEPFPGIKKEDQNRFTVFYFGGMNNVRGLDTLIRAAAQLKPRIPELLVRLVGTGSSLANLQEMTAELHLQDTVRFEGWQPVKYLASFIQPANVCVIPHLKTAQTDNSSPNKLFIYMMFQKAVIASNCKSIQQVVEENNCGLIFPSGNANALADAIYQLYTDKELLDAMGINALRAVKQKYDWNTTVQPLIHMYRELEDEISHHHRSAAAVH